MRFRQIHLDFHTNADDPRHRLALRRQGLRQGLQGRLCRQRHGVLQVPPRRELPPDQGRQACIRISSSTCSRAQIDALHAVGINAPVYLTATWDELAAFEHPEWRTVSPDGSLPMFRPEHGNGVGWAFLDFSTPYLDYLVRADRGGDGALSRRRRHLHGHLVPAAVDLVVGADQDGGARARLDRRARPRRPSPRSRSRTTSPASATRCSKHNPKMPLFFNSGHMRRGLRKHYPTTTPTSSSRACRPPAGATSTSRSAPAMSMRSASRSSA